jgi:glycosyltransferase involved in cell wall biosynthesis
MTSQTKKPKLLFISAISPWPLLSGGAVRTFQTLKELSKYFELYFIYFAEQHESDQEIHQTLKKYCKVIIKADKQPEKSESAFLNHFQPYWFSEWYSSDVQILIKQLIQDYKIKFVQVEFSQLLYLVNCLPKTVTSIFTAHDVSSVSFWRRLTDTSGLSLKLVHLIRLAQVFLYEWALLRKFALVISMSKVDAGYLKRVFKVKKLCVVPNGVEKVIKLKKSRQKILTLGLIGSFSHSPNRTAFTFFLNQIAPQLLKEKIEFRFLLAGQNSPDEVYYLLLKSGFTRIDWIKNLGFVSDVKDFYRQIDLMVAPILSGSGTRIKILESLAYQTPVVTTSIGAEGINQDAYEGLFLADTTEGLVKQIITLNKKPLLPIAKSATKTWEEVFATYAKNFKKYL